MRRCLVVDRPLGAQVIFTRQEGTLFRALHLSAEPASEAMLSEAAAHHGAALFVEGEVRPFARDVAIDTWMGLLYGGQRVSAWRRNSGHVLVFCDEEWMPTEPSEVIALRCRATGWCPTTTPMVSSPA